jgi:hypothetical protein
MGRERASAYSVQVGSWEARRFSNAVTSDRGRGTLDWLDASSGSSSVEMTTILNALSPTFPDSSKAAHGG